MSASDRLKAMLTEEEQKQLEQLHAKLVRLIEVIFSRQKTSVSGHVDDPGPDFSTFLEEFLSSVVGRIHKVETDKQARNDLALSIFKAVITSGDIEERQDAEEVRRYARAYACGAFIHAEEFLKEQEERS